MKILVTGGSGFLGGHLVAHLSAGDHEVLALVRTERDAGRMAEMGATPVTGDLGNITRLSLPPIDAAVHAAAYFRFSGPKSPYLAVNVTGTRNVLSAARHAGAKRFIHVSAAGIIMDDAGTPIRMADETAPTNPRSFSPYLATKAEAEALVLLADAPEFRTLALRPATIWGPGDAWSRQLPQAIASGRFMFFDRGDYAFSTTHMANVVEAVGQALHRGRGGCPYFIRDRQERTFREFVQMIANTHGVSVDTVRSIPYGLAAFVGRSKDLYARLARLANDPPLSRSMVRMIGREFTVSDAAARSDLGYGARMSWEDRRRSYHPCLVPA